MVVIRCGAALACLWAACSSGAAEVSAPSAAPVYLLRYKFNPGEVLRWKVTHRASINTTVSGTTQTAETTSTSVKVWKALPADDKGNLRFEHSVEKVEMRQKLTGREEVVYNSETDQAPPLGFEDAAKSVGIPLAIVTIDPQGNVVERQQRRAMPGDNHGQITVPLPAEAIPIGHTWSFPYDIQVPLRNGTVKQVKSRQHFQLLDVADGIATIGVETQILSPIDEPEIEAQLIQREIRGQVKFDVEAGRIIGQQMDLDKSVVGFSGESSSLHYVMRFREELLPVEKLARPTTPPPAQHNAASAARSDRQRPTGTRAGGGVLRRR
jgi:hypothetical protein